MTDPRGLTLTLLLTQVRPALCAHSSPVPVDVCGRTCVVASRARLAPPALPAQAGGWTRRCPLLAGARAGDTHEMAHVAFVPALSIGSLKALPRPVAVRALRFQGRKLLQMSGIKTEMNRA